VLQQLQDEGLVTAQESEGRKVFSITDEGRALVEASPAEFAEPWSVVGPGPRERLQGLMQGLAGVAGATKQIARLGTPDQVDAARRALDDARRALYLILAEASTEAPVEEDPEDEQDD
jgi:DNA-binding PadR family transcriptional regulator